MMLLPRPDNESGAIDWQQVLDFAQIGVVALTAYLYFFYIPSRWEAEGPQMVLRISRLQFIRDAALASGFLISALTDTKDSIRAFFGRMTGIFLVAGVSELIFLLAPYTSRAGAVWTDVIWCAPYLFATVIAGTWNREEESVPPYSELSISHDRRISGPANSHSSAGPFYGPAHRRGASHHRLDSHHCLLHSFWRPSHLNE